MVYQNLLAGILSGRASIIGGDREVVDVLDPSNMEVLYDTDFEDLVLPSVVNVELSDGTLSVLNVVWLPGNYDPLVAGDYDLVGVLQPVAGITIPPGINATIRIIVQPDVAFDFYVETTGNDSTGTGASNNPYLTISRAITQATNVGGVRSIKVGVGTFTLTQYTNIPINISIYGSGIDETIIKGNSSLNFSANIGTFQWAPDRFLLRFESTNQANGNQTIGNLTIDGDDRSKHGAIYINKRNNVTIRNVKAINLNAMGFQASNIDNLQILDSSLINCSISHNVASLGAITLGHNTNSLIERVSINEGRGYGIKAFGPAPVDPIISNLRIRNCNISVHPTSLVGGGGIANIALEIHDTWATNIEISNNYLDNTLSMVTVQEQANNHASSATTFNVFNNTFDILTRANGNGYGVESAVHNLIIHDNHFIGGKDAAITSWNQSDDGRPPKDNWLIYNNIFERQESYYPVGIVKSRWTGLTNCRILNNTVEITNGNLLHTTALLQIEHSKGGANITIRNNVIRDKTTQTPPPEQGGASTLIRLEGGSITNLLVTHNYVNGRMSINTISGGVYNNNFTTDPQLNETGTRPDPYFRPKVGSPLIGAGINVGLPFTGSAPTIGRYELTAVSNLTISEITQPNDRLVPTDTAFSSLGLPTHIQVELSDTTTSNIPVTWAIGSYDEDTEGIYTLTGTFNLPSGVTNPLSFIPRISIIVADTAFLVQDSFDRASIGSNYTIQGDATPVLDGSNMQFDGSDGLATNRILHNVSITDINDIELTLLHQVVEHGSNTYGIGIGIQNPVNPDPNKGTHVRLNLSNSASFSGQLAIFSGNSDTDNAGFTSRASSSTRLAVAIGNIYETKFRARTVGSDLVITASSRNTVTNETNSVTWTEIGAGSMIYRNTSKLVILHNGGLQQVNSFTARNLTIVSPFPNVQSVQGFTTSVANGTAFGSIGLPATRQVTLSDGSTPTYNITWQQGNYSPTTAGVYNLIGIIQIPGNVTNIGNIRATATITVQVVSGGTVTANYWVAKNGNDTTGIGSQAQPYLTVQKALSLATAGQSIVVRAGTYRETGTPANSGTAGNPITIFSYPGETVVISGLDEISDSGWNVYSGQIYRKAVTLPVTGFQQTITSNTSIAANQIFKNGNMMFEARFPKVSSMDHLFQRDHYRPVSAMQSFTSTSLQDNALPDIGESYVGAKIWINGWYLSASRTVTSNTSGSKVLGYSAYSDNGSSGLKRRRYYYITGKLGLLTDEKEWHYEGGFLYFRQPGGGSPTGVEFKARNWGFDLRNRSYITITGIQLVGCEINGNTSTNNIIIDGIKASYTNHTVLEEGSDVIYYNARQTGFKLIGSNNQVKNSEFQYCANGVVWLGNNCVIDNCYFHHISYGGQYGAPAMLDANAAGYKMLRCTSHTTGRSAFDFGYQEGGSHLNGEIAYCDLSDYGKLNVDMGGIYGARHQNSYGTVIHHNWIHDTGAGEDEGGAADLGTNSAQYLDQGFGPIVYHHNVEWNNVLMGYFSNPTDGGRTMPDSSYLYHNVFATNQPGAGARHSYKLGGGVPAKQDTQKNNIYRDDIIANLGASVPNVTNSVVAQTTANILSQTGNINANPLFLGNGSTNKGLDFRVQSGSPARNRGVVIPGITPQVYDTAPTAGAYQYGDPNPWVPGYNAVPVDDGGQEPGGGGEDPNPYYFEAEEYDNGSGVTIGDGNVGSADNNDWIAFNVNFAEAKDIIRINYARQWMSPATGQLEVRLTNTSGTLLATINLANTGSWAEYTTIEADLSSPISGVQVVVIVFKTSGSGNFNWFEFIKAEEEPGTGNIATLGTVADKEVPYNTDFGSNGAGLSLPQTISCTFEGGGVGTVPLTWTIGTYNKTSPFFADDTFTLTGTPVEGSGITNDDDVVVTCDVTVKSAFAPLTAPVQAVLAFKEAVTNTNNDYAQLDASNNVVNVKSASPGLLTSTFTPLGVVTPKIIDGKLTLIGTGELQESAVTTNYHFLHYNPVPADLKSTIVLGGLNITEAGYVGIMGNNGAFSQNNGIAISFNGTTDQFSVYITGNQSSAILYQNASVGVPGVDKTYTVQIDNSLGAAAGKIRVRRDGTVFNSTTTGAGVLDNDPVPAQRLRIGSFGNNPMSGTIGLIVIQSGVESDAVAAKFESDVNAYLAS